MKPITAENLETMKNHNKNNSNKFEKFFGRKLACYMTRDTISSWNITTHQHIIDLHIELEMTWGMRSSRHWLCPLGVLFTLSNYWRWCLAEMVFALWVYQYMTELLLWSLRCRQIEMGSVCFYFLSIAVGYIDRT